MRLSFIFIGVAALSLAHAERFITIPTGTKISSGTVRTELDRLPSENFWQAWLGYGVNQNIDVEIGESWLAGTASRPIFNVGYNYILPLTDISPGISFGIQDITNGSARGRAAYLALTYSYANDGDFNQETPTQVTFGFWTKKSGLLFVGVSLPFSYQFRLVGEHDGSALTAGVEFRPAHGTVLRFLSSDSRLLMTLSLTRKL